MRFYKKRSKMISQYFFSFYFIFSAFLHFPFIQWPYTTPWKSPNSIDFIWTIRKMGICFLLFLRDFKHLMDYSIFVVVRNENGFELSLSLLRLKCYLFLPNRNSWWLKIYRWKQRERSKERKNKSTHKKKNDSNICHQPKALNIWQTHEKGITFKTFGIHCALVFFLFANDLNGKIWEFFSLFLKPQLYNQTILFLYIDLFCLVTFFLHCITCNLKKEDLNRSIENDLNE